MNAILNRLSRISPGDHGREMTCDDFMAADYAEGHQYELIEGRLYVSPLAGLPQNFIESWIFGKLYLYALQHATIINYVSTKARVFIPGGKTTIPEPDVACYHDFPMDIPFDKLRWQDISPTLVIEILSEGDPDKDLVRNPRLYLKVPSIKEYWVFDTRDNPAKATLLVHRRQGQRWKKLQFAFDDTYTTSLLPGFALIVNPQV